MADKRKYSFIEERDSKGGKLALRLALISVLLFLICVGISFFRGGAAEPFVGAISIGAMLLSVYAFRIGMESFSEKNVSPTYSVIGAILSGVVMVGYITLFLSGIGHGLL